jgi:hypothetical protein
MSSRPAWATKQDLSQKTNNTNYDNNNVKFKKLKENELSPGAYSDTNMCEK